MLLLRKDSLPEGADWLYELKLDGYRALATKTEGKAYLRSRNDKDFTAGYRDISAALISLPDETWIYRVIRGWRRPSNSTIPHVTLHRE